MTARGKQIRYNVGGFLLLFFVSLYRQISLRCLPGDGQRTYILYACYCFLIGVWIFSIQMRVTQKSMRIYLMMEALVMFLGLTIRFVQDTFLTGNILLTRISGFWVEATMLPIALLGFYAALGLGQADSYRFSWKWYLLLIPVLLMTWLIVTDEQRHFVFYIIPEETQPNLAFHPYIGTFIASGICLLLVVVRILVIYRRSRALIRSRFRRWFLTLFELLLLLAFSFEYFAVSLQIIPSLAGEEVIELYAKLYYAEILTWEVYIYAGLVPTNTDYREIFEHSTTGMQLLFPDGSAIRSKNTAEIPAPYLQRLHDGQDVELDSGKELHLHRAAGAEFIWARDVSALQATIKDLNRVAETLAQEGILLEEELKTRNQEARIEAQNLIYDALTGEVQRQLRLMREMVRKYRPEEENHELLEGLVILGTYVKRRCNLRLIEKDSGYVDGEDLRLSFQDMVSALKLTGIRASLTWENDSGFSAVFSIYAFDMLEFLLEYARFSVETVSVEVKNSHILLALSGEAALFPPEAGELPPPAGCRIERARQNGAYRVRITEITEGGGADA